MCGVCVCVCSVCCVCNHSPSPLPAAGAHALHDLFLAPSNLESINRVRQITNCESTRIRVYICDMCDVEALQYVFETSPPIHACIQFAGLKAVGESVAKVCHAISYHAMSRLFFCFSTA